jgi:hypothetical protein
MKPTALEWWGDERPRRSIEAGDAMVKAAMVDSSEGEGDRRLRDDVRRRRGRRGQGRDGRGRGGGAARRGARQRPRDPRPHDQLWRILPSMSPAEKGGGHAGSGKGASKQVD